jgi:hypothetical protein
VKPLRLALLSLSIAGTVGAQQSAPARPASAEAAPLAPLTAMSPSAAARQLTPAVAAIVKAETDSAAAAGLPTDPLVLRALEGQQRGATPDRIRTALVSLRGRLRTAATAVGRSASEAEYVAAAGALAAGLSQDNIAGFRRERPKGSVAVPLVVASDLVARGVPAAATTKTITELLTRGADDRALLALRTAVQSDIAYGNAPRLAIESRSRGILAALPSLRPSSFTTTLTPPTP